MTIRNVLGSMASGAVIARRVIDSVARTSGRIRVLMYHDIAPAHILDFESHISFLYNKYNFIGPREFVDMMRGQRRIQGINLLLTFDDGFKSNYLVAEKVLKRRGIEAVFFVSPDFINCSTRSEINGFVSQHLFPGQYSGNAVPDYLEPMSWDELAKLVQEGHAVGAHTLSHPVLSALRDQSVIYREIVEAGDILESRLKLSVDLFAYPFGKISYMNQECFELAARRYSFLFSGVRGYNTVLTNPLAIRRDDITLQETPGYLQFIIEGGLSLYHARDRKKLDELVRRVSRND